MKQASFADFAESSGTDPFGFEDYGPTSRRPTPEAELAALYESGGVMVDRRAIPDSGLSLSDITDWPYINREESNPDEREHFEEIMSTIDDPRDDDSTDDDGGIDAEAYAKANVGRVAPIEPHGDDHGRGTTRAVADGGEVEAGRDLHDVNDLETGDEIVVDCYDELLTVLKPLYEPTGHSRIGVKVLDTDLNVHELRLVKAGDTFLDLRPDDDNSAVRFVRERRRIKDFSVVGHNQDRLDRFEKKLLAEWSS